MKERDVEAHYKKLVEDAGGLFLKFTSPQCSGVPDRIVILPDNHIYFVEFKAPNKKPRKLQEHIINKIRQLGADVRVIDRKVDRL